MSSDGEAPRDRLSSLRQNHETNRAILRKAGIAEETVPLVSCRGCGHLDSALFWTPRTHLDHTLHLQCPSCENQEVHYRLDRGSISYVRQPFSFLRNPFRLRLEEALILLLLTVALVSVALLGFREPTRLSALQVVSAVQRSLVGQTASEESRTSPTGWWARMFEEEDRPLQIPPVIYLSAGDRRSDLMALAEHGDSVEVTYNEQRDVTLVTVPRGAGRLHDVLVEKGWAQR